jgi:hypothetical protein
MLLVRLLKSVSGGGFLAISSALLMACSTGAAIPSAPQADEILVGRVIESEQVFANPVGDVPVSWRVISFAVNDQPGGNIQFVAASEKCPSDKKSKDQLYLVFLRNQATEFGFLGAATTTKVKFVLVACTPLEESDSVGFTKSTEVHYWHSP